MRANDDRFRASVIIVNYNGGEAVIACLESVFDHINPDCEVIVVDNASSDGSAAKIEARFPDAKVIRNQENLGFGVGNNIGAARASGEFLVFLNPDTLVQPNWLNGLTEALDAEPDGGLATSKILMAGDPGLINTCGNQVHLSGLTLCRGLRSSSKLFTSEEEVAAVSGAAFAMPRRLFEELGGFDEDMFLYIEDTDLSLRARLAGLRCVYTPNSVVLHDYRLKITPLKIFYQERNRYLMLLKNFRWVTLALLFPAGLAAEFISWGFVLLKDRSNAANKVRAYKWVLSNWKHILVNRRHVQSLRKAHDRKILRNMSVRLDFGQAAPPFIAVLGHIFFDPFFFLIKILVLLIVWW